MSGLCSDPCVVHKREGEKQGSTEASGLDPKIYALEVRTLIVWLYATVPMTDESSHEVTRAVKNVAKAKDTLLRQD